MQVVQSVFLVVATYWDMWDTSGLRELFAVSVAEPDGIATDAGDGKSTA